MMAAKGKYDLELEGYKDAFRRIPHPPVGVCKVKDLKVRHIDYDGNALSDTCQALEHMFEMNLYPKEITLDDIFVCNGNERGSFAIQILVLEADRLVRKWDREQRKKKLWIDVKTVFQEICNEAQVCLSSLASGFIDCIENGDVNMLEGYPDTWSWNKKACYLLYIIASDSSTVHQALQKAKFQWPTQINLILKKVLEYNKKKPKPIKYNMNDGYDYIKLCRHIVKHWASYCNSVPYLQRSCANVQDFLRKMEEWTPGIWCTLYKAMGWPRP
ncbi:hypothetical protein EJB05_33438 [Eragrostis curvula]|uniref:Uncharacterized protein n=1 Tax=Eragrostis curvula TaxID=38414 RepID=A0A5J9U151_9POAL|nr:hypothetical protein EJB05_33438 [Eragrostis curvula]